jgi:uncharacterized membrane protein
VRIAVSIAAAVTLVGGVLYLYRHGFGVSDYHLFRGEPPSLPGIAGILRRAAAFDPAGVIQFGVLILIAIPVLRVAAFGVAFFLRRDPAYSIITMIVVCILLFSLLGRV